MRKISLVKMKVGQKGKIIHIDSGLRLGKRLSVMGIQPGRYITKCSAFALRGPVAIRMGQSILALGYGMAVKIWVEIK